MLDQVISLESSPIEALAAQPEGTRFFAVRVLDPETGLVIRGSIAVNPDQQEEVRQSCSGLGYTFEGGLPWAAAGAVIRMIWPNESVPPGAEIQGIEETSREELLGRVLLREVSSKSSTE